LGGKHRDIVPCFATTGGSSVAQLIENVQLLMSHGWNVVRTGAARTDTGGDKTLFEPRESIAVTAEWLTKVREAVGSSLVLGIDYHHRLNVAETASFCQRMPSGTLDFLEEPIRDESPEAYAALRTLTDVPFAIGEEISSKWGFLPYIERGLTNFIRVDICNVGGFTEAVKVAGWAEAHYINLMPHNPLGPICTAASVHLGAAVPNFAWLEVRVSPTENTGRYDDAMFPVQPKLDGNGFPVSDRPGLGVEVNETLVTKDAFKFWEPPHLHRRDGSYTNW
jgi:galactonate dehydratase